MAYLTLSLFEKVDQYLSASVSLTPALVTENLLAKSTEVLCGYDYEKAIDVSNLINIISSKKEGIEHKCSKCSKTFTDAFQLERHKKRKVHERFRCELCPKNYATRFCLNRHARIAHSHQ